ncbi:hypothetical protein DCCM_4201 [Desulfocucumis palustris]|uniref:Uncharacterized protein n=1 Tax=Desulfocucumis palustris TaxID=1898651 RepID=A0A2L2XFR3_9FIRM|nr:hypothetical protein DCCM_4201 [Desulfocucumis palustris]
MSKGATGSLKSGGLAKQTAENTPKATTPAVRSQYLPAATPTHIITAAKAGKTAASHPFMCSDKNTAAGSAPAAIEANAHMSPTPIHGY